MTASGACSVPCDGTLKPHLHQETSKKRMRHRQLTHCATRHASIRETETQKTRRQVAASHGIEPFPPSGRPRRPTASNRFRRPASRGAPRHRTVSAVRQAGETITSCRKCGRLHLPTPERYRRFRSIPHRLRIHRSAHRHRRQAALPRLRARQP